MSTAETKSTCTITYLSSLDTAFLRAYSGLCRCEMFPSDCSRSSASVGTHILNVHAHAESLSESEFNRNQYTSYDVDWTTRRVVCGHSEWQSPSEVTLHKDKNKTDCSFIFILTFHTPLPQ